MALKDMISSDINTVFLNNSELAGIINFGGLLISAVKEEVFSQEAMTGKGTYERTLVVLVREEDIPNLPITGSTLMVDDQRWTIRSIIPDFGMLTISMKQPGVNDHSLTESIKVYRKTSARTTGGGREESEVFISDLWAIVTAIGSNDRFVGMKDSELRTHEIRLALTDDGPLQYGDVAWWRGIKLAVRGLIPDHETGLLIAECVYQNA